MIEYDVQRCSRKCSASGRELAEGEEYYSTVSMDETGPVRRDFAVENWNGPPEGVIGFWKARVPPREAGRPKMAPSDVLYDLFQRLANESDRADMRYVLALLLVRGRVLRVERTEDSGQPHETLVLFAPRDESTHRVAAVMPDRARQDEIQRELTELLFAGAT